MTADPKFADRPAGEKTVVYRVLKRYEGADVLNVSRRWIEQEPLAIPDQYVTARIVGEKYGEGDYIILPKGDSRQPTRFLTVIADRYYREAEEDE